MTPAVVLLSVLFFTSAILSGTLALAWLHFGRRRHVALWSLAYGAGALQWVVNALGVLTMPGSTAPMILASVLVLVTSVLVVIGARVRSGRPPLYVVFAGLVVVATVAVTLAFTVFPHAGLRVGITNLFGAAMMPLAAVVVTRPGQRATSPERAFIAMLLSFTVYQLALGATGLSIGEVADPEAVTRYRTMLGIGLPAAYIGTGIAAVFMVAADLAEGLRQQITRDAMTGTLNRRGLEQAATAAMAAARRGNRRLAIALADIDGFRAVNGQYGQAVADAALTHFADCIQSAAREEDWVARLGGDEFAILLVDVSAAEAFPIVERIRREVAESEPPGPQGLRLTASFGIANFAAEDLSLGDMLSRASRALQDAKQGGRDRVVVNTLGTAGVA